MNPSSHPHHDHQHHNHSGGGGGNPYLQGPPPPSGSLTKASGPRGTGGNGMPYMDGSGGAGSQGQNINILPMAQHGGHPMSIQPPPGWKSHHVNPHHQHPLNNCSPSSSISSNYGASHNYLQQSFYNTTAPEPHGANDGSIGHSGSNPANYSPVHNSPSPCPYYPPEQPRGSTEYYHPHLPQTQFSSFDPGVKNRRGDGGSCPNDETVPSHLNFYPGGTSNNNFFPIPQHSSNHNNVNSHHHHHHYAPEFPQEYSRMNYTGGNNNNSSSTAGDYFTGPASTNTRPSSSCPSYGHHHVSTPLEFHQQHLQSQQSFRRNSIESFSSESSEVPFNPKYGYSGNSNVAPARNNTNLHLIKRESVIPPPWSAEPPTSCQDQQESEQYFFAGATPTHNQYHRPPQSSSVHRHRCESVPQVHQLQHPLSCSFDDGMTEGGQYKKVTGVKPRSQSVSYSRNFEPGHFRTGPHYQHPPAPSSGIHPNKEVPVSSGDLPSQGQSFISESACSGRTSSGSFNSTSDSIMEIPLPSECEEEDEDAGMDSDSSSSSSQKSSFTPASADCNQSEDNISDIDEELKKEIQSVTTTTSTGSTVKVDLVGDEVRVEETNDQELNNGPPSSHSQPPLSNDPTKLNMDEAELSNSSLTLFDSIALNTFDSPAPGDGGISGGGGSGASDMEQVDNQLTPNPGRMDEDIDDQDSLSGLSSISSHQQPRLHHLRLSQSNSSTCGEERSRSTSPGHQKMMKRSFSEADKDNVIHTTAITNAVLAYSSGLREIQVPKGWRREVGVNSNPNSSFVFYISPSDTKLRSLEEVKNYVTSDGTCKCGLSCPLRLELAFSFDPKITNSCEEDNIQPGPVGEGTRRSCCSHRKIPQSEDSPLISSTRDDLGDSGDGEHSGGKKRRTDSSSKGTTTTTSTTTLGLSIKNETQSSSLIVIPKNSATPSTPVPFAQQSPDTTTQTPQRDMSPASSVSSDTSITVSSRSANSTPTPVTLKMSPNIGTIPEKGQGSEFAWPTPPGTTLLVRPQTPPSVSSYWANNTSPNAKKSKNSYQHHLISKSPSKRSSSPCPNVDVRQIPIEQNQPPPRQGATMSPISISISSSPGASQLVQPASVSLVPILSTPVSVETQSPVPLNAGYSISPVIPNQGSVSNTLQFTSILPSTSYCQDFIGGMGMPRLVNSTTPILSTGIQQPIPTSITISVVGQEGTTSAGTLPQLVQKSNARTTSISNSGNTETNSEKSPLQLVQDVVDRFHEGVSEHSTTPMTSAEVTTNTVTVGKETADTGSENLDNQSLESKIMKIIADAASASGKVLPPPPEPKNTSQASVLFKSEVGKNTGIRCGVNLSMLPVSSVPMSLPFLSSHQMSIQSLPQTIFTSNATTITTTSNSNPSNLPMMTNSILNCTSGALSGNPLGMNSSTSGISLNNGNQLILQQPSDPNNSSLRYPFFQTLQPIFLNPGGGAGSLLIPNGNDPQSFIQIDQNNQGHSAGDLLHQTMLLDPSSMSMCGNGNILGPGPKKKKKRLSKKQQQQAQLQLQQQILLQQLFNHQQVQQQHVQAAQQQIPLLLPPSFNLGPQGFLQPMNMNMNMNFFPTPTILTLPNLILNPADGTLFIQQAGPQISTAPQTAQIQTPMKIGGVPIQVSAAQGSSNILLPRKETVTLTASSSSGPPLLLTGADGKSSGGEFGIDDSSRQNATPDSSTNDCQLGLVPSTPAPPSSQTSAPAPMTVSLPLGSSTNLQGSKKAPLKSKVVSSSTTATVHKRILPQKQILPKIDSTTPSVENNS